MTVGDNISCPLGTSNTHDTPGPASCRSCCPGHCTPEEDTDQDVASRSQAGAAEGGGGGEPHRQYVTEGGEVYGGGGKKRGEGGSGFIQPRKTMS